MILHQPDWCRPRGFYLDPALIPPDDDAQDAVCALAAAVEHARLDVGLRDPLDVAPVTATTAGGAGAATSRMASTPEGTGSGVLAPSRPGAPIPAGTWSMWSEARL